MNSVNTVAAQARSSVHRPVIGLLWDFRRAMESIIPAEEAGGKLDEATSSLIAGRNRNDREQGADRGRVIDNH